MRTGAATQNGHEVVLPDIGHTDDFWTYQTPAANRLINTFLDSGRVDTSLYTRTPVDFTPEEGPPPAAEGFEWTPEAIDPARDLGWYDYVLVRGRPGLIETQTAAFELIYSDPRWRVFKVRRT